MGLQRVGLNSHFHFFTFLLLVVVFQKNSRKIATAPGNKIRKKKFLSPVCLEVNITMQKGAKFPKDRRIAKLEDHEKRAEDSGEDEGKNCELDQCEGGKQTLLGASCW